MRSRYYTSRKLFHVDYAPILEEMNRKGSRSVTALLEDDDPDFFRLYAHSSEFFEALRRLESAA